MNKHIKLYEEFLNEAADGKPKPASVGAKNLYKTYRKISDLMLNISTSDQGEALVLWGKALDHQDKEAGKPDRDVEGSNREDLKWKANRAKRSRAALESLEKQAEALEKACEPGELRALKRWWAAEKKMRNHEMNADWRLTDTAQKAYKILGDTEALKELAPLAQEHANKAKELSSAEMGAHRELHNAFKL